MSNVESTHLDRREAVTIFSSGLGTGGAEMMLLKILSEVPASNRANYSVISLSGLGTIGPELLKLGVETQAWRLNSSTGLLKFPGRLLRLLLGPRPTAYVGWMYHGSVMSLLAWGLTGGRSRMVWNIRHSLADISREKFFTRLMIRLLAYFSGYPDSISFNSKLSMTQHAAVGFDSRSFIFLPNGFDTTRFKPDPDLRVEMRQRLGVDATDVIVGMVARNHPMKDPGMFVKAMAIVAKRFDGARFVLAGRGMNEDAVISGLISACGLTGRFIVLGETKETEKLFNAFDLTCLTSAWGEGFPNVLGESLACGTWTVGTDVGDTAAVIGTFGKVVPPSNESLFAEAVSECLSTSRSPIDACAYIRSNFDIKSVSRQIRTEFFGRPLEA